MISKGDVLGGGKDGMGIGGGNAIKLGCDDHCTTINVIKFIELKKFKNKRQKKTMCYMYTLEYYSAIKKEQNNVVCSNMDGTRDSHTK